MPKGLYDYFTEPVMFDPSSTKTKYQPYQPPPKPQPQTQPQPQPQPSLKKEVHAPQNKREIKSRINGVPVNDSTMYLFRMIYYDPSLIYSVDLNQFIEGVVIELLNIAGINYLDEVASSETANDDDFAKIALVKKCPLMIYFMNKPSEKMYIAALEQDGLLLRIIKNNVVTSAMIDTAIKQNPYAVIYVIRPSRELIQHAASLTDGCVRAFMDIGREKGGLEPNVKNLIFDVNEKLYYSHYQDGYELNNRLNLLNVIVRNAKRFEYLLKGKF